MTILEHISLAEYTTFQIGGPARFFVCVKSSEEAAEALRYARDKKLNVFILGGGSNILIDDAGFQGLVIKVEIEGIVIEPSASTASDTQDRVEVVVGSGVVWDDLVATVVEKGFFGIENLSYIPGTVGAAPVQNIGAYGSEVKDSIAWVEAIDSATGTVKRFTRSECLFSYRNSFFKTEEGRKFLITRVAFTLNKNNTINTSYKDIAEYIRNNDLHDVKLADMRAMVIEIRKNKLPDVSEFGTAGSFFKNPIISREKYEELKNKYPLLPHFAVDESSVKIPAAWILDNLCGFKGYKEGNVGVYKNQALVLVNFSGASSEEIKNLADKMIRCVYEKISVTLEREVLYI